MAYFNGKSFTDLNGKWHHTPMTKLYCDSCAETEIPLPAEPIYEGVTPQAKADGIGRHWHTDFKWAPSFGAKCHKCGKDT